MSHRNAQNMTGKANETNEVSEKGREKNITKTKSGIL